MSIPELHEGMTLDKSVQTDNRPLIEGISAQNQSLLWRLTHVISVISFIIASVWEYDIGNRELCCIFAVLASLFYLAYLRHAFFDNDTFRMLNNMMTTTQLNDYFAKIVDTNANIILKMKCFHYKCGICTKLCDKKSVTWNATWVNITLVNLYYVV